MKLPGFARRRLWRVVLGTLILPPTFWVLVLVLLPTERFKKCVAERLSAASGRAVEIGGLRVGLLGGVSLRELRIGLPGKGQDPWLKVHRASIDVSFAQLIFGQIEPTRVKVDGFDLRVRRRSDGTLELSEILESPSLAATNPPASAEPVAEHPGLEWEVRGGRVLLIDEPTSSRLEFLEVQGQATCRGCLTVVEEIKGTVNGGPFHFSGQSNREEAPPTFGGRLQAENVALGDGMNALAYLIPIFSGTQARLDGKLSLDLALSCEGETPEALRKSLQGQGKVALDPILLDGSKLLAEFGGFMDLPPKGRVGAVRSSLKIGNGRVTNDHLTIDLGRVPVVLSGSTGFDGDVNYRLRSDTLTDRIPSKARQYLSELEIDLDNLPEVRVQGTVDDMIVKVNGQRVDGGVPGGVERRDRLREIGRRIRESIQR